MQLQFPKEKQFKSWLKMLNDSKINEFEHLNPTLCPVACYLKEYFHKDLLCTWVEFTEIYDKDLDEWNRNDNPDWISEFINRYDSGSISNANLKQWAEQSS